MLPGTIFAWRMQNVKNKYSIFDVGKASYFGKLRNFVNKLKTLKYHMMTHYFVWIST
jgi:hypothetical protein